MMISKRNLAWLFIVGLLALMFVPTLIGNPPPNRVVFYMTLPAPTSIGPKPLPTATHIPPPTLTPTMKTCTVFMGKWVGPCQP